MLFCELKNKIKINKEKKKNTKLMTAFYRVNWTN